MNIKSLKYIYRQVGYLLVMGITLASCSEWNEVEPIEIIKKDFTKDNPAEYQKYLDDLKEYKSGNHNIIFGWYDNSVKNAFNQSHHISQTPDSIDYLVLKSPDNLSESELLAIKESKDQRAIKFLYDIDIDAYINTYNQMTNSEKEEITLLDYVNEEIKNLVNISTKYPYDGVVVSYSGRDTVHMSIEAKNIEKSIQGLFQNTISTWKGSNTNKEFIYKGNPQSLFDKTVLADAKYIILPTTNVMSKVGLSFALVNASVPDVPKDKFVVIINSISYKEDDKSKKVGYFVDGSVAITSASEWILSTITSDVKIKGLAIENLQYDYFNIIKSYQYSREAINTLNPSIKK